MPAPVPFLYVLKCSVGSAAGCGITVGVWHTVLELCGVGWDSEGEDLRQEYDWLPEAKAVRQAEAFGGLPGATFIHPAEAAHPLGVGQGKCDRRGVRQSTLRRWLLGRRLALRPAVLHTMYAATFGSVVGIVGGIPAAAAACHVSAAVATVEGAKAAVLWCPLWAVEALMGTGHVCRNLPVYTAVLFLFTAPLTVLAPALAHTSSQSALMCGLRVVAHGQGAICIFSFVNRYSTVQWSKPAPTAAEADEKPNVVGSAGMVLVLNAAAVVLGQLAGNAAAGSWLYVALTDSPGSLRLNKSAWLACYGYILVTQVHLVAPLEGHDDTGSTKMLRTAMTGIASAAVAIPPRVAPPVVLAAVPCVVFMCFAVWLGSFGNEWGRLQRRSIRNLLHHAIGRLTDGCMLRLYYLKWRQYAGYAPVLVDDEWEFTRYDVPRRIRVAVFGRRGADQNQEIGGARFGEATRDWM